MSTDPQPHLQSRSRLVRALAIAAIVDFSLMFALFALLAAIATGLLGLEWVAPTKFPLGAAGTFVAVSAAGSLLALRVIAKCAHCRGGLFSPRLPAAELFAAAAGRAITCPCCGRPN